MRLRRDSDTWIQGLQNSTRKKKLFVSTGESKRNGEFVTAEGDLVEFSKITSHFSSERAEAKEMFKPDTRPDAVERLYQEAAQQNTEGKVLFVFSSNLNSHSHLLV